MSFGDSVIVSLGTVSTRRVGRSKGMHMFLKIYKKKKANWIHKKDRPRFSAGGGGVPEG